MTVKFGAKKWFVFVIAILILTDLTILLDIPFLRQIFGFLFLTILPGVLILQILKLDKIDTLDKFILSWGLSISFLMFFGLLINILSLSLGYDTPLATIPLLVSFNIAFILLALIASKTNINPFFSIPNLDLSTTEKAFLIVPILFPALSIFGMRIMNTTDNNIILMFLLFLIAIYVVVVCFFNQIFPTRLYPVVIYLISISLLLLMTLRSNYLIGSDIHTEYYFFLTTMNNSHWSVFGHSVLDACLSISLLPTLFQNILNIPSELLFKALYPVIYSISPLIIYILSKKYVGESYAFLASCFFMFQYIFLSTTGNARTCIAVMFFAVAMMVLFTDKIDLLEKKILLIVFMASCMVSHYSTAYIFFFILLGAFVGTEIVSKKATTKKVVSLTIVLIFFTFIFFWYSQVTEVAFNAGVSFIEKTLSNLNTFFIMESRGGGVPAMFGEGIGQKGTAHRIEFIFTWLTFAFIGIGVITLIRKSKEMSFPRLKYKKPDFLREKFEVEYVMIALLCTGLLIVMVALPIVSKGYGIQRLYATAITILSVIFVIGGVMIAKYLNKLLVVLRGKTLTKNALQILTYLVILFVLIPYFLSVTGAMYQVFGAPRAITLNSEGEQYKSMYIHDTEVITAKWLKQYASEGEKIYTDLGGTTRLVFGYDEKPDVSSGYFRRNRTVDNGYIYLRYRTVVDKEVAVERGLVDNLTNYTHLLSDECEIYNNGYSQIHKPMG